MRRVLFVISATFMLVTSARAEVLSWQGGGPVQVVGTFQQCGLLIAYTTYRSPFVRRWHMQFVPKLVSWLESLRSFLRISRWSLAYCSATCRASSVRDDWFFGSPSFP